MSENMKYFFYFVLILVGLSVLQKLLKGKGNTSSRRNQARPIRNSSHHSYSSTSSRIVGSRTGDVYLGSNESIVQEVVITEVMSGVLEVDADGQGNEEFSENNWDDTSESFDSYDDSEGGDSYDDGGSDSSDSGDSSD
ncbi:hypothetical protein [Cohnella zeiphila]|uniref:Uncharacterized protein n=1 Tax=Cohnella zeiphila TaxID=2761120 RepID=A0A7X0SNX9_9BACL|nr:hypothetical protein [Cohnella zeiphila]MBB6733482.1 hypothetical protein [Cohnella zeiphila]